jgi:hypothetical protein
MAYDTRLLVNSRYPKREGLPEQLALKPEFLTAIGPSPHDPERWDFRDDQGRECTISKDEFRYAYDPA